MKIVIIYQTNQIRELFYELGIYEKYERNLYEFI